VEPTTIHAVDKSLAVLLQQRKFFQSTVLIFVAAMFLRMG
jgi:hypothetical protein